MAPTVLRLVRVAMLVGMTLFAGIAWYQAQQPDHPHAPPETLATFRIVAYALCGAAFAGVFVLKQVRARAEPERRSTFALIASSFAEGAGFMGCVYILQGGEVAPFVLALVVFLASWTLLPADPDEL